MGTSHTLCRCEILWDYDCAAMSVISDGLTELKGLLCDFGRELTELKGSVGPRQMYVFY